MKRFKRTLVFSSGVTGMAGVVYLMFYIASKEFKSYNVQDLYGTEKFNVLCQISPETCKKSFEAAYAGFLGTIVLAFVAFWAIAESMTAMYQSIRQQNTRLQHNEESFPLVQCDIKNLVNDLNKLSAATITNHKIAIGLINKGIDKLWNFKERPPRDKELALKLNNIRAILNNLKVTGYVGDEENPMDWRRYDRINQQLEDPKAKYLNLNPSAGAGTSQPGLIENDYMDGSFLVRSTGYRRTVTHPIYENVKRPHNYENVPAPQDKEEYANRISASI